MAKEAMPDSGILSITTSFSLFNFRLICGWFGDSTSAQKKT